jgi:hypothetical protein
VNGLAGGLFLGLISAGIVLVLPVSVQIPVVGVALGVAGGVYVGFGLTGADPDHRRIQWIAAISFLAIGAIGISVSAWLLAVGWLLHAVYDAWHHGGRRGGWVPRDYPLLCLSYDVVLAAVAAYLALGLG